MLFFFFFNDTATTEIYTLSLHDALPICSAIHALRQSGDDAQAGLGQRLRHGTRIGRALDRRPAAADHGQGLWIGEPRSEEHTSELQSQSNLVCRLLLEKKKKTTWNSPTCHEARD